MNRVAVLIEDQYQVLEVWYPYLRLKENNIETVLAGPGRKKEYTSKEGYPAREQVILNKVKVKDFDGVIIPGGYAPDILRRYPEVNSFVRNMFRENKIVAAICHGGWVLVSAGILKGKKVTGFYAIKDDLINAGAIYLDKKVVIDDKLITSRNPDDLPYFCKEIIKKITGK